MTIKTCSKQSDMSLVDKLAVMPDNNRAIKKKPPNWRIMYRLKWQSCY